ncbi:hypothetical protein [Frankia sp. AvcI1]|uniref:hypothetical protein n=1 Tax=Frankia sp. AvcI1 TaxID=573496 RepID=UPI002117BFFB|nr:hypothetical protein [Frankia sp. AvcI1]
MSAPTAAERVAREAMTVTVIDRAAMERTWGSGPGGPILVTGMIAGECPTCGGPRGPVRSQHGCEDGEHYHVSRWDNPCGHVDDYRDVVREIRTRRSGDAR